MGKTQSHEQIRQNKFGTENRFNPSDLNKPTGETPNMLKSGVMQDWLLQGSEKLQEEVKKLEDLSDELSTSSCQKDSLRVLFILKEKQMPSELLAAVDINELLSISEKGLGSGSEYEKIKQT